MRIAWVVYRVSAGSIAVRGHMTVYVHPHTIERKGERDAVARASWELLRELGVRKRFFRQEDVVFDNGLFVLFKDKIKFIKTGLEWRDGNTNT